MAPISLDLEAVNFKRWTPFYAANGSFPDVNVILVCKKLTQNLVDFSITLLFSHSCDNFCGINGIAWLSKDLNLVQTHKYSLLIMGLHIFEIKLC